MLAKSIVGLIFLAGLVLAQEEQLGPNGQPRPEPYSFSYAADSSEGAQATHQETGDGTGRITGVYTIAGPDGRERRVEYVADADGYRAVVKTNEIGTQPTDSGDARFQVSQPSEAQLAAANRVRPIEQPALAPTPVARPTTNEAAGSDSPASQQQQREQIPSANSISASATRPNQPIGAEDQQQQTLVNLDDISDQPPQEQPVAVPRPSILQQPQQVQIIREQQQIQLPNAGFQAIAPQQPQQQQITQLQQFQVPIQRQEQVVFEQPRQQQQQQQQQPQFIFQGPQQQPFQIIGGPQQQLLELPAPNFSPRQPQGPIFVSQQPQGPIFVSQQPQGQAIQVQLQQQQQNEDEGQRGLQQQQPAQPQPSPPQSIQEIKSGQPQQQQQFTENLAAPIGPGSAGQRGPEQIQSIELGENRFSSKTPQQPAIIQAIEQPQVVNIQQQEQAQPIQPQQVIQLQRIERPQPQPIRLPEVQFRPQAPQQNVVQIVEQRQPIAVSGVKGASKTVAREQQPQVVQRIEPAPQPQIIQRIEPAPQPQFIQGPAPQQFEIIQQPQLIQGPIEPEIQVPNFAIERINPLPAPQSRPVAQPQPQQLIEIPRQQQVIVQAPQPTQGIKIEPIFKQITVSAPGPAPVALEQPREQQQVAKGQVEIINLKEEPKQADSDQTNENDSQDDNDNNNNEAPEQQSPSPAPIATPAPAPAPAQTPRPVGRLVFGKTRFGAPTGAKIGTKTIAVQAAQPERQASAAAAPQPAPASDQALIQAPAPAQVVFVPAPAQQQANQFIAFGTRLGTKN